MGLILHILMFNLTFLLHHTSNIIPLLHLLMPGIGLQTSQPGYHLYLLNLLPLLKSAYLLLYLLTKSFPLQVSLQGILFLQLVLQLQSLALRHLSLHFSRESSPETLLLLTGKKIGTR